VSKQQAFDRATGEPIDPTMLKTYAEALTQFHLSTEDKFENGDFCDTGRTERRHVVAVSVGLIGKEANKAGARGEADPTTSARAKLYYPALDRAVRDVTPLHCRALALNCRTIERRHGVVPLAT